MKYISKLVSTVAVFSMLFLVACGGGDDSPITDDDGDDGGEGNTEAPGAAIIGTWTQNEAEDIIGPAAEDFTDFEITISASDDDNVLNYTATDDQPLVFPTSGTFTLPEDPNFETGAQVTREDQVPVTITLVNETQLRMVFTIAQDSSVPTENSRSAEIGGEYTFLLDKE